MKYLYITVILSVVFAQPGLADQTSTSESPTILTVQVSNGTANGSAVTDNPVTIRIYQHKQLLNTLDGKVTADGKVAAVFATALNLTGMIFSRAEWNIWWTPSPRLITSAALWFLFALFT